MTASHPLVQAFAHVTFGMGTAAKRFAQTITAWPPERELTPRAEAFAWRLAYIYRRQLPAALAEESLSRKVSHIWHPIVKAEFGRGIGTLKCSVCQRLMYSERERNAPCPGPPEVKPERKRKRVAAAECSTLKSEKPEIDRRSDFDSGCL